MCNSCFHEIEFEAAMKEHDVKVSADAIEKYKRKVSAKMWSRYTSRQESHEFDDGDLQIMRMMLRELDRTLNYEHKDLGKK